MVETPEHSQVESTTWPLVGTTCPVGTEYTISLPSLAVASEPGKRHARRANKLQVDSDWLNPNSLGIMSAFSYIENLA